MEKMEKCVRLSDYALVFSTREKADKISDDLINILNTIEEKTILTIDFTGVEAISYSFMDELLSRISKSPIASQKGVAITGWSHDLVSVVDKSLQRRNCISSEAGLGNQKLLICPSTP